MSETENDPQPSEPNRLRAKYQEALQLVWRKPDNCPICDSNVWNIGGVVDVALRHPEFDPRRTAPAPKVYVYVPVTCIYCGYTIFFHSGVLDVRLEEQVKAVPPLRPKGEPQ